MSQSPTLSVYDPEIDMNTGLRSTPVRRIKRLIISLLGRRAGGYLIGNPCRSVDRETQEYSPLSDR
jgi:hypothetical protein